MAQSLQKLQPTQIAHIQALSADDCKEMLSCTSVEAIQELASIITQDQYEYAVRTLFSQKKVIELKSAWESARLTIIRK